MRALSSMSANAQSSAPVDLFGTVVAGGCCIGCGACAAFDPGLRIKLDEFGRYVATRPDAAGPVAAVAARVCPFADGVPDENELARDVFGADIKLDAHLGHQIATYAGWVTESDFRVRGSSGGLGSWVVVELLRRGLVDRVVHVASQPGKEAGTPLFNFTISSKPEEVRAGAKSRYYPVEMSGVIRRMLEEPGSYAVVGIPCFIKAIRLACRESAILRERVKFTVAVVCGHLKSTAFAELFAWQCGIEPSELRTIDFRTKQPGRPALDYAVTVKGERDGQQFTVTRPTAELFGSNWGHGFFKYKACDFCDDVVGETADISVGDAWLPEYVNDSGGTNVVVVRSRQLHAILDEAAKTGRLHLDAIPAGKVVESQAGGFRHRRDGLAYRLQVEDQAGRWRPAKRVQPSVGHLSSKLREIYALRYELGQTSHAAFAEAKAKNDLDSFIRAMAPLTARYDRHYRRSVILRIVHRIKRTIVALIRK
jgi:coenzyme F420 hydrogenase subunit beta